MRSIHIQKDKTVFKLSELPAEEFAASMGLPGAPQIKLLDSKKAKVKGPAEPKEETVVHEREVVGSDESDEEDSEEEEEASEDESKDEEDEDEDESEDSEGSDESEEETIKVRSTLSTSKIH